MTQRITQSISDVEQVEHGQRISLTFQAEGDDVSVPALLLMPTARERAPAALLLHGYSSRKEHMADSIGLVLLRHQIASMAIDLPLHGERVSGERTVDRSALSNPLALVTNWKLAQQEVSLSLGYLAARKEIDRNRLAIVGYSMGSFLGVQAAASSPQVKALVLAAGGDLPEGTPFTSLIRMVADPLRAVRKFDGKPLLMVNGRHDRTITPEQAQRLFDAAMEPKQLRWWNAGHYLPEMAIDDAAVWLTAQLNGNVS